MTTIDLAPSTPPVSLEPPVINLFDPAYIAAPHEVYAALHEYGEPVFDAAMGAWLVTSYDQVRGWYGATNLSHTPRSSTLTPPRDEAEAAADVRIAAFLKQWLVQQDNPHHDRQRALMSHAFIPKAIARIQPYIEQTARRLLDKHRQADGIIDLVPWAFELTNATICTMIGLPEEDWPTFVSFAATCAMYVGTPHPDRVQMESMIATARAMFGKALAERRTAPREDVLTALLQAREGQEHLVDDEITAAAVHLLFAGQETTANSLISGVYELVRTEAWVDLCVHADAELLPNAVEEILRWSSPLQWMTTFRTTEPVVIGSTAIPENQFLWMGIAAANRDEAMFVAPNTLNIRRPNAQKQVAFGRGMHFCLGAALARTELTTALQCLMQYPHLSLTSDVSWRYNPILRGLNALPVQLNRQ